ncbi:DUF4011 domain-containing anti-phage protein Hhe [Lentisalinibacter sediminis]|uniref:DUF4011 domain-containing anti-phage protein Hhe n=1 Tax=Lentisalinibacter sediminis TaxID=2992237 RepID=UPI003869D3BF
MTGTTRTSVNADQIINDALENLRRRLLDLTSRNRLLHFTHPKSSSLRAIDELPDQLKEVLLDDGREMSFRPVPEPTEDQLREAGFIFTDTETSEEKRKDPTAKDWAEWLGLSTSYEMPQESGGGEKHQDSAIQTLFFPQDLEGRLRGLRQKANTALEETGANILYLALGFLEWYDLKDSGKPRLAPLFLIPVRLEKGKLNPSTNTYEYRLKHSGEDVLTNISLREKLKNDFAIALPDLDEEMAPEGYFAAVESVVLPRQPTWRVRRYVSLALLNFSKQLMYLDLDPERWPEDARITDHPIIRQCLAGLSDESDEGGAYSFEEEYIIDDIDDLHKRYPLVDNADSSQHSALKDALDGKSLVIEGPPGTGKSQTITNLIAAAIATGKRVLFVAEKMAALQVVKRNLDQAGLGEFCLELHSNKSQKRKVLDDVAVRLRKKGKYRSPTSIDREIQRHEDLKKQLRSHAERINALWRETGMTVHEILIMAARTREELGCNPAVVHPEVDPNHSWTPQECAGAEDLLRVFTSVCDSLRVELEGSSDLADHAWCGVTNIDLRPYDSERIVAALEAWQHSLSEVQDAWTQLESSVSEPILSEEPSLPSLAKVCSQLSLLPSFTGSEITSALPRAQGRNAATLRHAIGLFEKIQATYQELARVLAPDILGDQDTWAEVIHAATWVGDHANPGAQLSAIASATQSLDRILSSFEALDEPMRASRIAIGVSDESVFAPTVTGLQEFAEFANLVASLPPEYWSSLDPLYDDEEIDAVLPSFSDEIRTLRSQRDTLSSHFAIEETPSSDVLQALAGALDRGGLLRWLDKGWRTARKELLRLRATKKVPPKVAAARLKELIEFQKNREAIEASNDYKRLLGPAFAGIDTDVERHGAIRAWYRNVRSTYGIGFGPRVWIGEAIFSLPHDVVAGLRSLSQQGLSQTIQDVLAQIDALRDVLPGLPELSSDAACLTGEDGVLIRLRSELGEALGILSRCLTVAELRIDDVISIGQRLDKLQPALAIWQREDICTKVFGGQIVLKVGPGEDNHAALDSAKQTARLARVVASDITFGAISRYIYSRPERAAIESLQNAAQRLADKLAQHEKQSDLFNELVGLDERAWVASRGNGLAELIERNQIAMDNPETLGSWLGYIRARADVETAGWSKLASEIENDRIATDHARTALWLGISDHLARQILRADPNLSRFTGPKHSSLQDQFKGQDQKIIDLQREYVAWCADQFRVPRGISSGLARDLTETALLRKEIGKKRRHVPLRQLVRRAGGALSNLKPCFLMGPMSVAQYLAPGKLQFDLVVMDEASQIKPEDALGAIGRGAQLVVVGDPKQLPPTSFFDKLVDEDDVDQTAGEDSESILEAAMTSFPARRLRWHYRSRHESLITYSNHAFYDNDLVVFPSPAGEGGDLGVKFTRVQRGRFVSRRNLEEAKLIAEAVAEHLLRRTGESIGVVAMNTTQQDQIEQAIEVLAKENAELRDLLVEQEAKNEPLFVKNLENVQGDERDVIVISMTYGPQEIGGRTPQRFGPINGPHGWRRLNVLFTRAKRRMHVFSSMTADDVLISPTSSRGVIALRGFLEFAQRGTISEMRYSGDREPDSEFEVAVSSALDAFGFECVAQVGVAGFFIDIAVKDPGNPSRFLMGIECDGATYHSAKSTRDRDRLRQQILEGLGWRIRRIWSTDWFENPRAQIRPILEELNRLKTIPQPSDQIEPPAESEVIEELAEQRHAEESFVSTYVQSEDSLEARLMRYDRDVIRIELPNTPENRRLLRPAMMEALLEYEPTSLWEFQQIIPPFLRKGTDATEAKEHLARVLEIVYESQSIDYESTG